MNGETACKQTAAQKRHGRRLGNRVRSQNPIDPQAGWTAGVGEVEVERVEPELKPARDAEWNQCGETRGGLTGRKCVDADVVSDTIVRAPNARDVDRAQDRVIGNVE